MSCRDMRMPIVCRWKAFASGIEIESEKAMKRLINLTQCAAIVFFALQFCLAVFAQGQKASLGATEEVSQTSQTGAGMGSAGTTAGKSGKAGVSSSLAGKVSDNFPEGLTLPVSASAMAPPPA